MERVRTTKVRGILTDRSNKSVAPLILIEHLHGTGHQGSGRVREGEAGDGDRQGRLNAVGTVEQNGVGVAVVVGLGDRIVQDNGVAS